MENTPQLPYITKIIEHLETLWKYSQEPSPESLKRIAEFINTLNEPYKTIGLTKIAEHAIGNMALHMLALMATFQQKSQEEGISSEEYRKTFERISPEVFRLLDDLSKNVSIHSFDDLAALSNITLELQTLSQTDSADEARSWLIELPTMYSQQLAQENLIVGTYLVEPKVTKGVTLSSSIVGWTSYRTKGIVPTGSIIKFNIKATNKIM